MKSAHHFLIIIVLSFFSNIAFGQEFTLKDSFDLSIYFTESEEGDSLLTFKMTNNSLDSIKLFPPGISSSKVVYVLPDQKEFANSVIFCAPGIPGITVDPLFSYLPPDSTQIFVILLSHYKTDLNLYRSQFGYNATYQIYWKVHDGHFSEETVFGSSGRSRVDRKPTYLRSNTISIKL